MIIPGREVVQNRVDISPQAPAFRHKHPGEEIIYVLEGSLEYQIDGKSVKVKPGDVLFVPAGAVHSVKNIGTWRCTRIQNGWSAAAVCEPVLIW